MARRRKKNPLLMRILVVTIVAHIILLPIAAHFGAFDKLKRQFGEARVTLVPLPKQAKEKDQAKEKKAKPKVTKTASKVASKRSGPAKADPNRQKVVAVNTPGDNAPGQSGIVQGTQTDVGVVHRPPPASTGTKTVEGGGTTTPEPTKPTVVTKPPPPIVDPQPTSPVATPKKEPKYVEPEQDYSPQPTIPDDLRSEPLDKNFVALFTVGPDGNPIDVTMTQSTGNSELDAIALKTAKQWKFKPATLDGVGTSSKIKLTIEFRVE